MLQLSPEKLWSIPEKDLLQKLEASALSKTSTIHFYAPSFTYYKTKYFCSESKYFPTISITGTSCALNCGHCGGKVLETMHQAKSPDDLFDLCLKLKLEGARGCLISGGCLPNGSVPFGPFLDSLGRVKRELGLTVFVHSGVTSPQMANSFKKAGVDAALIDVLGSEETIRNVLNLKVTLHDYSKSLKSLEASGLNVVPHVIVGLNKGKLDGELEALKMISQIRPSALVIIAFMPIHGTEMETVEPPNPLAITKVVAVARTMFNETPLVLGCMRPKGKQRVETDVLAIKAGVDAIAFPAEEAISFAQRAGRSLMFSSTCCSQIYADLARNSRSEIQSRKGFG